MDIKRYREILKEVWNNKINFLKHIDFTDLNEKIQNFKNTPMLSEVPKEVTGLLEEKSIKNFIENRADKLKINEPDEISLLIRTVLNSIMEKLRQTGKENISVENYMKNKCPFCSSSFKYSYIDKEGKKFLVCSTCGMEWRYLRIKCPFCETEEQKKLSYIEFEDINSFRFYECENCGKFHKVFLMEKIDADKSLDMLHLETLIYDISYAETKEAPCFK